MSSYRSPRAKSIIKHEARGAARERDGERYFVFFHSIADADVSWVSLLSQGRSSASKSWKKKEIRVSPVALRHTEQ